MRGRTFVGLLLVVLGIGFLLDRLEIIQFITLIEIYWPVILILIGVSQLFSRGYSLITGVALILIGVFFTLGNLNLIPGGTEKFFWPILLIVIGLFIAFGKTVYDKAPENSDDILNHFVIFSGLKDKSISKNFKGGDIAAIFGGIELDLRDAHLAEEGALLNLTVAFGGIEVRVPNQWKVIVRGTPIFGGWDNKTSAPTDAPGDRPVLNIKCLAMFGGIEIDN
ncbi:MAG: LiaI-LiaF-like domain-containing protein [Candidatus Alkaliphilus sp. MAG34]